jgi:integrase
LAVGALRFLYKVTLKKRWTFEEIIPLPKKPKKLPVILNPEEVVHFLSCVDGRKHRVILTTCYAAGLRISEAVNLKPAAIDSRRMVIRVESGKNQKCFTEHFWFWTNPLRGSSLRGGPKSQRFPKPSLRAPITRAWSCCDLQHLPTLKGVRHDCTSAAHD